MTLRIERPTYLAIVLAVIVLANGHLTWAGDSALHNVFEVTDDVYSGSEPEGDAAFEQLASMGIKTIVSVDGIRPDLERAAAHGIEYVHVPMGYDGIPVEVSATMAKALKTRTGPFYIHCHHGKHRGPALAAIALRLKTNCDDEAVRAWMEKAGVGENYEGLWKDAADFEVSAIEGMDPELVSAANAGDMASVMAVMSRIWERLQACEKAGWQAPPDHPDVSPPHEALMLHELFREMAREPHAGYEDAEFTEALNEAVELTGKFSEALKASDGEAIASAYALVGESCKSCHYDWRD